MHTLEHLKAEDLFGAETPVETPAVEAPGATEYADAEASAAAPATGLAIVNHSVGGMDDLAKAEAGISGVPAAVAPAVVAAAEPAAATLPARPASLSRQTPIKLTPLHTATAMQESLELADDTPVCVKCHYPVSDILKAKLYGKTSKEDSQRFVC